MNRFLFAAGCCALFAVSARAETIRVGQERAIRTLQEAAPMLKPGDVLEVDGGATYQGMIVFRNHGTAEAPIIIRGVPRDGRKPVLSGVGGVKYGAVVKFTGDHYVFEGFDATAGGDATAFRVLYSAANDVTIRDTIVRDAACTGIHGSDSAGSLTLERVEVFHCGSGDRAHQIYVATDNTRHPRATFRMRFCRVHDGRGGNNVKSRAGRSEIYFNWIEGAAFHEFDLIGADVEAQRPGTASAVREDADVVGNVFYKTAASRGFVARLGSDGSGASDGRYRFVNNTIVVDAAVPGVPVIVRLQDAVQSVEMHNNVVFHGGAPVTLFQSFAVFERGRTVAVGSNNWLPRGSRNVPDDWRNTITGDSPGFRDAQGRDFFPAAGSPLIDAGALTARSPRGFEFPAPLEPPRFQPPVRGVEKAPRPVNGPIDIGAFEFTGGAVR